MSLVLLTTEGAKIDLDGPSYMVTRFLFFLLVPVQPHTPSPPLDRVRVTHPEEHLVVRLPLRGLVGLCVLKVKSSVSVRPPIPKP